MEDIPDRYCPVRYDFEERGCTLTNKMFRSAARLLGLVGLDHAEFLAAQSECGQLRKEFSSLNRELTAHRSAHGC